MSDSNENKKGQLDLFPLAPRNDGHNQVDWAKGGLTKIHIERFKKFESYDIDFGEITLLVGANSSGKTSILQAVRLFFWCVNACKRKQGSGWRFAKAVIPFSDFHLIPAHSLRELSFQGLSPNRRTAGLVIKGNLASGLTLSFRIYASYSTLMVIDPEEQPDTPLTNDELQCIDRPPLYIPGFFGVVTRELLAHDARLEELLNSGHHNEVLRNIILRLKGNSQRLEMLVEMLHDEFGIGNLDLPFSQKESEYLKAEYTEPNSRIPFDFVSAGSGFLQVLQIMAHALQNPSPVVLLDEPDAHMHHSLQKSFLRVIRKFASEEGLQVIMASHSETFLRESPLEEIRIVDSRQSRAEKFPDPALLQAELSTAGIWPSNMELAEILRTKRLLLVEGTEDEVCLNKCGESLHKNWAATRRMVQIITSDGSSDSTVQRIEYLRSILARVLVDGVQVAHMRDRDLMCDEAVRQLRADADKKGLPLFVSERRNRESILVEPSVVARALLSNHAQKLPSELSTEALLKDFVHKLIMKWCQDEGDSLSLKISEYNGAWTRRADETDKQRERQQHVQAFIRIKWNEPISRGDIPWELLDGKAVLKEIRKSLQAYRIALTEDDLFSAMASEDYDTGVKDTIALLRKWAG